MELPRWPNAEGAARPAPRPWIDDVGARLGESSTPEVTLPKAENKNEATGDPEGTTKDRF